MFGWYLTGIILVTVLVNTLVSLWGSLVEALTYLKAKFLLIHGKCRKPTKELMDSQTVPIKPSSLLDEESPEKVVDFES